MKNPESLSVPVRTKRPPRLHGSAYVHRPVHLTLGTFKRQPIFATRHHAALVLGFLAARPGTLAVCVLADHVHWLLASSEDLTAELRGVKSTTTLLLQRGGWCGKVWQRGVYDRVVRDRDDLRQVASYVADNALRSGLVESGEQWPYSVIWWSRLGE